MSRILHLVNLKPAVNRQPLFPRGGPEELAEPHNETTKSEYQANFYILHVAPRPQQLSLHTLGLILRIMLFCVYISNYIALPGCPS